MSTHRHDSPARESLPRSAVSPSSADLLALKLIVLNLAFRMASYAENTTGVPAGETLKEVAENCQGMLRRHSLSEFPPRDVQQLREQVSAAVAEFLSSALPADRKDQRGRQDDQ